MFSSVAAFNNGSLNWRITHDAQEASDHLIVEGQPPESLAHIEAEEVARVSKDREVDFIFEVPIRVAHGLVGFRHDEESSGPFEVLRVASGTKPKWKLW